MSTYCEPFTPTDWTDSRQEDLYHVNPQPLPDLGWIRVTSAPGGTAAVMKPELTDRFLEQANKWERETAHLSSPNQRMMHPSYQAILGMAQGHENEITVLL